MSRLLVMVAPSNHKIFASSLWSSNFSYDPDKMRLTISWVIWTFCLPIKSLMWTYLCKKRGNPSKNRQRKKRDRREWIHWLFALFSIFSSRKTSVANWAPHNYEKYINIGVEAVRCFGNPGLNGTIDRTASCSASMIAIPSRANVNLLWRPLFRLSEELLSTIAMAGCNLPTLCSVWCSLLLFLVENDWNHRNRTFNNANDPLASPRAIVG